MNEGSKLEEIIDELMPMVVGKRILDIGTGFGTVVTKLLQNPSFEVVSIDPEAWHFADIEREFSDAIKEGRLKLSKARVQRIPYDDRYFDTSLAITSLHHVPETHDAIKEIERVTRLRVIIVDWDTPASGVRVPHSAGDLLENKDRIISYARKNGYNTEEKGEWFLAWK
ncbi:hypothetical protein IX51_06585 [uncultured archaeon]|nr:hypothetical protein IX51_06585 [uncultured archaeon]